MRGQIVGVRVEGPQGAVFEFSTGDPDGSVDLDGTWTLTPPGGSEDVDSVGLINRRADAGFGLWRAALEAVAGVKTDQLNYGEFLEALEEALSVYKQEAQP